jgi:hypothetical protein
MDEIEIVDPRASNAVDFQEKCLKRGKDYRDRKFWPKKCLVLQYCAMCDKICPSL